MYTCDSILLRTMKPKYIFRVKFILMCKRFSASIILYFIYYRNVLKNKTDINFNVYWSQYFSGFYNIYSIHNNDILHNVLYWPKQLD